MVSSKIIGGIVVAIAIIAITAYGLNSSQENNPESQPNNSVNSHTVSDSAKLTKNNDEFTIDEKGNKKYVISASDSPALGD